MEWKRVSLEGFQAILEQEMQSLSPKMADALRLFRVPVAEQSCFRGNSYGIERVFVVARNGDRLLFYDDVEEEFGVEAPGSDGVLRNWGTYGGLGAAVAALVPEAP